MTTTAIFIELLIGGIQASFWLVLLILTLWPSSWRALLLPQLDKWPTLVTVVVFACWYTLGIAVDRVALGLFLLLKPAFWLEKLRPRINKLKGADVQLDFSRVAIAVHEGKAFEYLLYFRMRGRILRVTFFNLLVLTIATAVFEGFHCDLLGCGAARITLVLSTIVIGIVLLLLTGLVAAILEQEYGERVTLVKKELARLEHKEVEKKRCLPLILV